MKRKKVRIIKRERGKREADSESSDERDRECVCLNDKKKEWER